ncbi:MAG: VOC family protein [Actinomycetota bacterium]
MPLSAASIGTLADFYTSIGMRSVARLPGVAILELRGGTHLAISRGEPGQGSLDLMVDDLEETRALLVEVGARPSEIRRSFPHRVFEATDPERNRLLVNSSHVAGEV